MTSGMWAGAAAISADRRNRARTILLILIAVTSLLPLAFVSPEDASLQVNVYKYLAKIGAFLGSMFMIWQFLLGFRGVVSRILPDLEWVVDIHKKLGQFGVPLILLHPIFIGLFYLENEGVNIFALDLSERFSQLVLLGIILITIVAFIFVTSAFFREKLGFYPWLYTHLSSYIVPPLLFVHSFLLGPTIQGTFVQYYWWFLTALVAVLYVYRLLHKLGVFSARYTVAEAREVGDGTTEVRMEPAGRRITPDLGQFIYLRHSLGENSHPYTVSAFDPETGALAVTAKEQGPQTSRLQDAATGDEIILDGPFGVFTRISRATDLPLVMLAGGIGITPFRRIWQELEPAADREAHVFYANEKEKEISYREEIDSLQHINVVHVLNDEPDFEGEHGVVTAELLRKYLDRDLAEYQFLVCGPPPMITSLEEELTEAGVPEHQVAYELFAS